MTNWKYCTPEQGRRLVELGIEAGERGHFLYKPDSRNFVKEIIYIDNIIDTGGGDNPFSFIAPAFCVAELGVLLPPVAADNDGVKHMVQWYKKADETHSVMWLFNQCYNERTEADARANLLIYLLENNHVTAADCNKRLREVNNVGV